MPFKHGLFGCFDNIGLCIITYFVPCYTFGKNAEAVGENCLLCGLAFLIHPLNIIVHTIIRGKIREMRNIEGSILEDLVIAACCVCCALVQEGQEVREPAVETIQRT
ncbi:hypothetical protein BsWGS_20075 [Bradybaena similaris]